MRLFECCGLFALQVGIDGVDEHVSVDAVNGTGLLQVFAVGHYAAQAVHAGAGEYLGDADIGLKDLFDGHIFSNGHCIFSFFGGFSVIVYHFGGNFKYFFGHMCPIFKNIRLPFREKCGFIRKTAEILLGLKDWSFFDSLYVYGVKYKYTI